MRAATASRRRGDPLLVLALVVGGWIAMRAAILGTWPDLERAEVGVRVAAVETESRATPVMGAARPARPGDAWPAAAPEPPWPYLARPAPNSVGALNGTRWESTPPVDPRPVPPVMPAIPPRLAGGHAMLWLAAVAHLPGPLALLEQAERRSANPPRPVLAGGPSPSRWSADAWALVRSGGDRAGAAPFAPTYGGSQVGAVLRYRLAPANSHRPTAYLRASAALASEGEREVAAGLSLRPVPRLPLAVAGEVRVTRIGDTTQVRPAVMAVTEIAPIALPAKTRAEFYLQGGYVGGRDATPFVDGSVRIDRRVAQVGPVELRAGAGVWGGAQNDAQRLDVGPTATLGFAQGRAAARVGLDWRLRVAGEAEPQSGPALTISAGF